ncbi:MAG: ABC transporter ATP-binding protein [Candidatus Omnitrophica bacterium]|nr:ABC transporter ATP-binding protein [Candidatus Omnitrophota bacterium]
MNNIAIKVKNLSKQYRIGEQQTKYRTIRETLTDAVQAPFRRIGKILQGHAYGAADMDETIWALKDVSFEVKRGEVVGIIGRNGAGKSTLLKMLSRITEPTEGMAEIHGRVGSLLEVGTGFHPELTGRENIFLNGAILGMKKKEMVRKFDEMVSFAEIEKFIDTPVKFYSSGMYVRLAFAVAAHLEPEILLVDEVLAVGDAEFQKKCLGKMGDVAKGGRTVLFVSHNMLSLKNLCNKGVLLHSGRVVMENNIDAVISKYLDKDIKHAGETSWSSPEIAPGDDRVKLKAVRVISEGNVTGEVDISKDFWIEIDYWNLEPNKQRMVFIHIHNSMGIWIISSGNLASLTLNKDPWSYRPYPEGVFRTACKIPGCLLNDGHYNISVYIAGSGMSNVIIAKKDVLSFSVLDTGLMREEYTGAWPTVIRPRLEWGTEQLSSK